MVRREHNSKLIVTMPAGAQTIGNTDGKLYFKDGLFCVLLISVPTVIQVR